MKIKKQLPNEGIMRFKIRINFYFNPNLVQRSQMHVDYLHILIAWYLSTELTFYFTFTCIHSYGKP